MLRDDENPGEQEMIAQQASVRDAVSWKRLEVLSMQQFEPTLKQHDAAGDGKSQRCVPEWTLARFLECSARYLFGASSGVDEVRGMVSPVMKSRRCSQERPSS